MVKKILLLLLLGFIGLQFFRTPKNRAPMPPGPDDLLVRHHAPAEVRQILQAACYDCHSNTTRYPWYAEVQPVGWWLGRHIDDAKAALNLSELGGYTAKRQAKKLEAISDEMTDHSMPLPSYTWTHRDARLTPTQIKLVTDWTDAIREELAPE